MAHIAPAPPVTCYVTYQQHVVKTLHSKEPNFTSNNIEKALSNVGHKEIGVTEKWLHAHQLDSTLDTESEREYILFLCPTGPFLNEVSKFYEQSYAKCGSNSAHNLFPHVTLTSFFKASDSALPYILDNLKEAIDNTTPPSPTRIRLSLQSCEGFIGIFLGDASSRWLQDILDLFVNKTDNDLGVSVKPQTTQFHLTLAYNFDLSKTEVLSSLARNIKLDSPVRWELNLYSRNVKFNSKQFQVVLHNYKAKKFDELDLIQNHYIVMDTEQTNHKGWRKGRDFDTGKVGLFPESFTKKTAEWRLWTKNFSFPITNSTDRQRNEKDNTSNSSSKNSPSTSHPKSSSRRSHSMNLKRDKKDSSRSSNRSIGGASSSHNSNSHRSLESRRSSAGGGINNNNSNNTTSSASNWETVVVASTAISNPAVAGFVRRRSLDSIKNAEEQRKAYADSKSVGGGSGSSADENFQQQFRASPSRSGGGSMREARVVGTPTSGHARSASSRGSRDNKRNDRENTARILRQASHPPVVVRTPGEARRLFFVRHAERVDLTFGHDWFQVYIDDKGYHRRNLNLPRRIPTRRGGPKDFFMDGPISEIGTFQAKLIGEALRAKGVSFTQVFCSPSLRCVQTATSVLEGLAQQQPHPLKIKVEPALFEWMGWCRNRLPKFMTVDELADYGLPVDRTYSSHYTFGQFNLYEKTDEYYYRTHGFVEHALRTATGNTLMFGHSATLDVGTRQLIGQPIRKTDDLVRVVQKVPFCGVCVAEETITSSDSVSSSASSLPSTRWRLAQPPIPSLAHGQNSTFDWRVLETTVNGPPYGKGK